MQFICEETVGSLNQMNLNTRKESRVFCRSLGCLIFLKKSINLILSHHNKILKLILKCA